MKQKKYSYEQLLELCLSRKSTRVFDNRPVPLEILEKIRTIALTSPFASGRRSWTLTILQDRSLISSGAEIVRKKIASVATEIREDMREGFIEYSHNFLHFSSAPVLVMPVFHPSPSISFMIRNPGESLVLWEHDNAIKSISCVAMLVLLAAESLGVGACYMTGPLLAGEELGKCFGVPPGKTIGAVIPIGYSKGDNHGV